MAKLRVGVLRGGPSSEYDVSIKTGANVLRHLEGAHVPVDIFVDKQGQWHDRGAPRHPSDIVKGLDVVFNAMHGEYGEDGKVQRLLEHMSVPFTGATSFASAMAMNKKMSKKIFKDFDIKTPYHTTLKKEDFTSDYILYLFRTFPMPAVVKPMSRGSSLGVSLALSFGDLEGAIEKAFQYDDTILIEEYINGGEATCGVIDDFRGSSVYPLIPLDIKFFKGRFFDYDAKYDGDAHHIAPSSLAESHKQQIQDFATRAHSALGLRHYSRADFMVHPKRGVYILEVNSLPGLTNESLMPQGIEAVGSSMPEFLNHVVQLAVQGK